MNRLATCMLLLLRCLPFLLVAGCASVHRFDSTKHEIIAVPDGLRDPAVLQGVGQRLSNGLPVVFKAASGEQLPLRLLLDLPMGSLDRTSSGFEFDRDTWFLLSSRGMELSPDGQRWASLSRPKAIAKLFGAHHGEVSFGFTSSTNDGPFMRIEVKTR